LDDDQLQEYGADAWRLFGPFGCKYHPPIKDPDPVQSRSDSGYFLRTEVREFNQLDYALLYLKLRDTLIEEDDDCQ